MATSEIERRFVNQPQLLGPYRNAVDWIVRSRAARIGLVLGGDSWEYPVWWLLRERRLDHPVRIEHVMQPGDLRWPLGPFSPDVVFWSGADSPPMLTVEGLAFVRVSVPGTVAVYARAGLAAESSPIFQVDASSGGK